MNEIDNCYQEIDFIVGHFCATCFSYVLAVPEFERIQREGSQLAALKGIKLTLQQFDEIPFGFGRPETQFHYQTTHGKFKERIKKDGIDTQILANNTLVLIYHIWEDKYRDLIAVETKVAKSELTHDTIGELRNIRRSIVHNKSKALKECENNINLKRFNEDEQIIFTEQEASDAFRAIKDALLQVKRSF